MAHHELITLCVCVCVRAFNGLCPWMQTVLMRVYASLSCQNNQGVGSEGCFGSSFSRGWSVSAHACGMSSPRRHPPTSISFSWFFLHAVDRLIFVCAPMTRALTYGSDSPGIQFSYHQGVLLQISWSRGVWSLCVNSLLFNLEQKTFFQSLFLLLQLRE